MSRRSLPTGRVDTGYVHRPEARLLYRGTSAVWCLLFLYAAAVQLNDPDPVRWMLVYGIGAGLSATAVVLGRVHVGVAYGWAVACVLFAVLDAAFGVGQTDPMGGFPHQGALRGEITREVLGLLLMSGWMAVLAWWTRRRSNS